MSIKGVSSQLMLGKTEDKIYSKDDIRIKLTTAKEIVQLEKLCFWNAGNEENFPFIIDLCKDLDIEIYCWFPVLADCMGHKISLQESTESTSGTKGYGLSGKWNRIESGEENFLFACPENKNVLDRNFDFLQSIIETYKFDGFLLDRIRYPSFANGLESVFSCFCPDCMKSYGENSSMFLSATIELFSFLRNSPLSELKKINSFSELISNFSLEEFINYRFQKIEAIVDNFSSFIKYRGLKVGINLLSPSICEISGQNYSKLSLYSDWIKSMIYCFANGPAGIPLEITSFAQGLASINKTGISEEQALSFVGKLFNIETEKTKEKQLIEGVPTDFFRKEYQKASDFINGKTELIPGMELVKHPFFTPPITKKKCTEYIEIADSLDTGIIASWNIMYIPDDYLKMIKKRMS